MAWLCSLLAVACGGSALAQGPLDNGVLHLGAIVPAGEVDSWTFSANTGDRIILRVGEILQTNSFTPRIRLMNPLGTQQATASGALDAEVAVTATNSGTFTVMVDGVAANATGTYRLTLAKSPGAFTVTPGDEGGPMTNAFRHRGVIEVGDLDVWSFPANAGDGIVLRMGTTNAFNPWIRLYGPDGLLVAQGFDGSSGIRDADLQTRATNSGAFTVVVGSYYAGGAGNYILTLAKSPPGGAPPDSIVIAPGDEGGPMANGFQYAGGIEIGDVDVWSFPANAGDSIVLRMGGTGYNPYIRLFGPNGVMVGQGYDGSSGVRDADLQFRATNSGVFTVVVGSLYLNGNGAYILTLAKTPGAIVVSPGDEGGPMTNGVQHAGTINQGDVDVWSFSASAGDSIVLRMGGTGYNPHIRLFGPDGVMVIQGFDGSSGVRDAALQTRATNSGVFTVVVGALYLNGNGAYILTLAQTPGAIVVSPGDEGGPMTNGFQHAGVINQGDLDVWSFSANAGDGIVLRMGGTGYNPHIRLFGPNGVMVAQGFDSSSGVRDADLRTQATNSGVFTVVVGSYYLNGNGNYILTLAKSPPGGSPPDSIVISPGDEGGPMTNGFQHAGVINQGDVDVWSFSANAGDGIVLRMGGAGYNPHIRLFGPNGAMVAQGFDSSSGVRDADLRTQATNSGVFTVVVGSYYLNGNGAYILTLAKAPGAIVISPGDEGGPMTNGFQHAGTINIGDADVWTFSASAGDSIVLRMGGTGYNPYIRLFGPTGVMVAQGFDGSSGIRDAELRIQATNSGVFTVVVGSYYLNGNGTYILTLARTPGAIVVSPGDEGGPMANGFQHAGFLQSGDIDVWSFSANAGDSIALRMGTTNAFNPWIRLFGPNGVLVAQGFDGSIGVRDAELRIQATNSGVFTVVVGSYYLNGAGNYILTLGLAPGTVFVSTGDQGGPMTNEVEYLGSLEIGDMDVWRLPVCQAVSLRLVCEELSVGSTFSPRLRLFSPTGALLATAVNATTAVLNYRTTNSGSFTLIVDGGGQNHNGTYRLAGFGIAREGLALCSPFISGTTLNVSGLGGLPGADGILYTHTEVETPFNQWVPISTNQFDQLGVFTYTNRFDRTERKRFFYLKQLGGISAE